MSPRSVQLVKRSLHCNTSAIFDFYCWCGIYLSWCELKKTHLLLIFIITDETSSKFIADSRTKKEVWIPQSFFFIVKQTVNVSSVLWSVKQKPRTRATIYASQTTKAKHFTILVITGDRKKYFQWIIGWDYKVTTLYKPK